MAKRFTDTEKWKKKFFKGLQTPYKVVWLYLLDECNHAGVWEVEFDVLKIRTGITFSKQEILDVFNGKILEFDDGCKWFIQDFIDFQYGVLSPENRAHNSVITLLQSYKNKGLIWPLQGPKDKDKDKDKDNKVTARKFYDKQIELSSGKPQQKNYRFLVDFLFGQNELKEPLKNVLSMPSQIKYDSFEILKNKIAAEQLRGPVITETLYAMNNWSDLHKRKSVYSTLNTWIFRTGKN